MFTLYYLFWQFPSLLQSNESSHSSPDWLGKKKENHQVRGGRRGELALVTKSVRE